MNDVEHPLDPSDAGHDRAAEQAADLPIGRQLFAVVDVETSGLEPARDRVLQVGCVVVDGSGAVIDRWSSLIGRGLAVWRPVGPTHVHGIRRRDLWRQPSARDVLTELAGRIGTARLVAHNAPFDTAFLASEARRAGVDLPLDGALCTLRMSRALDPDRTMSHRLGDLCERYGIPLIDAHDALADAEATAALLPHLLRAHGVHTVGQLSVLPPSS